MRSGVEAMKDAGWVTLVVRDGRVGWRWVQRCRARRRLPGGRLGERWCLAATILLAAWLGDAERVEAQSVQPSERQVPAPGEQASGDEPPAGAGRSAPSLTEAERRDSDALGERARQLYLQGRDAYYRGDFETALRKFRAAFEMADIRPRVFMLVNIGQTLDRLGREEEALRYYEQYLQLAPDGPNVGVVESRVRVLRRQMAEQRARERAAQERVRAAERRAAEERRRAEMERVRAEAAAAGGRARDGAEPLSAQGPAGQEARSGASPWPWIAAGGGVLLAGAVVAAVVLLGGGGETSEPSYEGVNLDWRVETLR